MMMVLFKAAEFRFSLQNIIKVDMRSCLTKAKVQKLMIVATAVGVQFWSMQTKRKM